MAEHRGRKKFRRSNWAWKHRDKQPRFKDPRRLAYQDPDAGLARYLAPSIRHKPQLAEEESDE
jgi:hypothetical protein